MEASDGDQPTREVRTGAGQLGGGGTGCPFAILSTLESKKHMVRHWEPARAVGFQVPSGSIDASLSICS